MKTKTVDSAGGPTVFVPGSGRKGDYLRTYTGRHFWPLDPRPEDVCIEDIAHALSMNCRWTGHCQWHYSVAQHSVFVCDWVLSADYKLVALLHDASEAYISDIAKPVKRHMPEYQVIEMGLMKVVATALGFSWPEPYDVKVADLFALGAEMWHLFSPRRQYIDLPEAQLEMIRNDIELSFMTPKTAEEAFLSRYAQFQNP